MDPVFIKTVQFGPATNPYLSKNHFNIIMSTARSVKQSLHFEFSDYNSSLYVFHINDDMKDLSLIQYIHR